MRRVSYCFLSHGMAVALKDYEYGRHDGSWDGRNSCLVFKRSRQFQAER